jgi:hypothetical protein
MRSRTQTRFIWRRNNSTSGFWSPAQMPVTAGPSFRKQ